MRPPSHRRGARLRTEAPGSGRRAGDGSRGPLAHTGGPRGGLPEKRHHSCFGHLRPARRAAGGRDLLRTPGLRRARDLAHLVEAGPDLALHPPRGRPSFSDPGWGRRDLRARSPAPRAPDITRALYELTTP